jgi:hypothetical protein
VDKKLKELKKVIKEVLALVSMKEIIMLIYQRIQKLVSLNLFFQQKENKKIILRQKMRKSQINYSLSIRLLKVIVSHRSNKIKVVIRTIYNSVIISKSRKQ